MTAPADPTSPLVAILGAGQLGRMLAQAAGTIGVRTRLLDPSPDACAGDVSDLIVAEYDDQDALRRLAEGASVVTYEFENVPVATVRALERVVPVRPPPRALEVAQDRLNERELFARLGIDAPRFERVDHADQVAPAAERLGAPCVLKARRLGYDGKGQHQVTSPASGAEAWDAIGRAPAILDEFVPFTRELSIIGARSLSGETAFYPLIENVHRGGILRLSRAPALDVPEHLRSSARRAAEAILEELDYVGVLAVEFFQVGRAAGARLLANEIAPRVHNTGHLTIDGAVTSQFENHLRAVLGMELGPCDLRTHCAMVNLIGEMPPRARVEGLPGAHFHDYAKAPRPGRKLGHVTLTAGTRETLDALLDRFTRLVA